mgnify:CR=1 FL=1
MNENLQEEKITSAPNSPLYPADFNKTDEIHHNCHSFQYLTGLCELFECKRPAHKLLSVKL